MKATFNKEAKTKFTASYRKEAKCYFESYQIVIPPPHNSRIAYAIVDLRLYGTDAVLDSSTLGKQ